jgi:hypothetical protein
MIHSLSGGVIAENGTHTFVKVIFSDDPLYGDRPYWYLCPFSGAKEGDHVLAAVGRRTGAEGVILKVEECSTQCAPFPMNRITEIEELIQVNR